MDCYIVAAEAPLHVVVLYLEVSLFINVATFLVEFVVSGIVLARRTKFSVLYSAYGRGGNKLGSVLGMAKD